MLPLLHGLVSQVGCVMTDELPGSLSVSDTFVHEADFVMVYTVTSNTGNCTVVFRSPDGSSNGWIIKNVSDGLALQELISGSPTNRVYMPGVCPNGTVVGIKAVGTNIYIYADGVEEGSYSSATNFQYETDGFIFAIPGSGALDDLQTWPLCGESIVL